MDFDLTGNIEDVDVLMIAVGGAGSSVIRGSQMYFATKCASKHHQSASKALSKYIKALQSSSKHFKALQFSKLHFDRLWCGQGRPNDGFSEQKAVYIANVLPELSLQRCERFHQGWQDFNVSIFIEGAAILCNHCTTTTVRCTDYVHMHVQQTSGTVTIVEEAVDN